MLAAVVERVIIELVWERQEAMGGRGEALRGSELGRNAIRRSPPRMASPIKYSTKTSSLLLTKPTKALSIAPLK